MGFSVHFREQVGSSDIDGNSARERQCVFELGFELAGEQHAEERGRPEQTRGAYRAALALAARKDHRGDGEAFGKLVQEHRSKDYQPEPVETRKPAAMATPSKKVCMVMPS